MIWFISDTHFGHKNIIEHCNRPFSSVEEMDRAIIDNINSLVRPNDTLYHLGDFAFRNVRDVSHYRQQINCKNIHLILGNHDYLTLSDRKQFSTVSDLKEIRYAKQVIIMCHYAMRIWNKSHYGSILLFGHSHGMLGKGLQTGWGKTFDVGVDCWDFKPINIDQVLEICK